MSTQTQREIERQQWIAERNAEHQRIKDRIAAAGYKYPDTWDEMGGSEKDMWEDRMIRRIEHQEARQAKSKE